MSFQPNFDFVEELRWRGLLHDAMPGTQELLNTEQVTGYVGFDPTADSLHIGNLVPITQLMHFQRAGHIPVALVGGATGMVGDPSGKTDERKLLDVETINHNIACQKAQLEKFIEFGEGGNKAKMVNNYDWFKNWSFLDFIRDVGKHITVSYMMSKDSVRNRLESGGFRLLNLLINWFRVMIFCICIKMKDANSRWEAVISGEISPRVQN